MKGSSDIIKTFKKTVAQIKAVSLAQLFQYILLFGGSRSGKTIICIYIILVRAMKKKSRHVILRFRFNDVKTSIGMDTLPKLLEMKGIPYTLNRSDWVFILPNGSEIWLGGLDDKQRVDKILGREYSTIYFNEASQISYHAYTTALTRLAENAGFTRNLVLIDCNPPDKDHWLYSMFIQHNQPGTEMPLANPELYGSMLMNPVDNPHLPEDYISSVLMTLPERQRARFLRGEWLDRRAGALWTRDMIDKFRKPSHPTFFRVAVGVDPAVTNNEKSDETGIIVAGLGTDGEYYIITDRSLVGSPSEWGQEVVAAYQYHLADIIVGEVNQGGDLVETNIKNVDRNVNYLGVRATRGKLLRAEPIAGLYEMGKVHHVDYLPELEEQMISWAPGDKSPDRMDALVYAIYALMGEEISGIQPNNPTAPSQNRIHPALSNQVSFTHQKRPPSFGGGRRR